MVAHLLLTLTARQALAAIDVGVNGNQLADLQAFHAGTDLFNVAGKLVAQNDGRGNLCAALAALIDVYVRTADTAGADTQQHLTLTGFRKIQFTCFDLFIAKKIRTNHGQFPLLMIWMNQIFFNDTLRKECCRKCHKAIKEQRHDHQIRNHTQQTQEDCNQDHRQRASGL